jgi:LysM repeat protein
MNESVNFPGADYVDEYPQMSHGGWLDKYDDGGLTTTDTTRPPTAADSSRLRNNAILLENFYNNKRYTEQKVDNPNLKNVKNYLPNLQEGRAKFDRNKKGRKTDAYYKPLNENQFYQRELSSNLLDLEAPMALYDKRITPQRFKKYTNNINNDDLYSDDVEMYQYDPLAVTPFNQLSEKDKVKRVKLYGRSGVPSSYQLPAVQPKQKPQPILKTVTNNIDRSSSFPIPSIVPKVPALQQKQGDYTVRFQEYDTEGNPINREVFFPTRKEADDFMNTLGGQGRKYNNITSQGNYQNGGWLDKYQDGGSYIVKKGDTLSKISKATGVPINELIRANKIKDANVIGVNQKLVLPTPGQSNVQQEWQNWSDINAYNQQLNALQDEGDFSGDERRISGYYKNQPDEVYTVVDKKRGRLNVYKGDKLINTYPVGTGENPGDAQTVTRIANGKVDWSAGNKMTGAGVYTVAGSQKNDPHYSNAASWNFVNDRGENVATALHSSFGDRTAKIKDKDPSNNRVSNGCVNGICYNLDELYNTGYTVGNKMYVLPEDRGNTFQIVDGKPVLRVNTNINNYNQYKDAKGRIQKGQGANRSVNTLVYKPIQGIFDRGKFQKNVYTTFDFNDDNEYENTTKPYYTSLVNNKKKVMQAANIPSDVYNEIARIAFGIYGTESNFGDTHSAIGNFGRAVNKFFDEKGSSSPDYKSKATTYGADEANRSVGLTQIRWAQLNNDEKKALAKVGVTSNKDFLDPTKAAMGTAVILGIRYNQQLTSEEKKNMWKYLPTKWNKRTNYADRVKNNAQYLTFRQYDDKRKMGGEPCYECGGTYANGGSTGWLNQYI